MKCLGDIDMKYTYRRVVALLVFWAAVCSVALLGACSQAYYGAMEKVGIHKRDILVDRVEAARDAQSEAQKQFTSAL